MTSFETRKMIVVADDQAFIRSLLVSMLRELGYRTLDAADGTQAMQQLAQRPYAAILDHRMAGQTGLEILRAIRCGRTRSARELPVLLITGHADEQIVRVAGELDVSALLTKPISKAQLRARLDAAAKTPIVLKARKVYAAVDTEPAECEAPARQTSSAWILKDTIAPREAAFVTAGELARRAGVSGRALFGGETHYSRLQAGMVLSKDLYTSGGKLLLAAGSEISESMAKRLTKVCEDNPEMTYLSIAPTHRRTRPSR
jgi:CheY-like chemotaxis protein